MNRLYNLITLGFAAVLLCASCKKDGDFTNPYDKPMDGLEMFTGVIEGNTRTTVNNDDQQTYWQRGDAAGVFAGEFANSKFTLKENQGQSAVFEADADNALTGSISKVYAYFPYNGSTSMDGTTLKFTLPAVQQYAVNTFGPSASPMVAVSSTQSLTFKHLCGVMTFVLDQTVVGTVKTITLTTPGKKIAGAASVDMEFESAPRLVIEQQGAEETITIDCGNGVDILSSGVRFFFVLPEQTYDLLEFEIENTNGDKFTSVTRDPLTISRGGISTPVYFKMYIEEFHYGKANCIVFNSAGSHSFDVTPYFSSDSYGYAYELLTQADTETQMTVASSAGLLWQSKQSLISNIFLSGDGKTVSFDAAESKGNALIAIYDSDGTTILWSFHVWLTELNTVTYPNGYQVLDRNLGAVSATPSDGFDTWGLFYQWGRKDPFHGYVSFTGGDVTKPVSATFYDANNSPVAFSHERTAEGVTHRTSISKPTTFLSQTITSGYSNNADWIWVDLATSEGRNNKLWGNPDGYSSPDWSNLNKSIYDPCPEGYMVSPNDLVTANGVVATQSTNMAFDATNYGRTLTYQGLNEWYPNARQRHNNGTTVPTNHLGRYWYSSPANPNSSDISASQRAQSLTFEISEGGMYPTQGQARAFGYSVRCIKHK